MCIFKDVEMVEQLGSGIPRILKTYPKSSVHFSENFLRMTFVSTENVTENRESLIVKLMQGNPEITTTEIANRLNVTRQTIARDLEMLKTNGIITRVGSNKTGYWQVKEK